MSLTPERKPVEEVSELIARLGTHPEYGLTSEDAARRLAEFGPNTLVPKKKKRRFGFVSVLKEPMIWLLVVAAVVYLILGETTDAVVLIIAIVPIGATDIILERRAEKTLEKLKKVTATKVLVIRDQKETWILSEELVPGDILLVKEGDVVAADAVLLTAAELQADESSLTGEATPAVKEAKPTVRKGLFGNEGALFAGTKILSGRGQGIVTATAAKTEYGRIGSLVASIPPTRTPLQVTIDRLVRILGIIAALAFIAVIILELALGANWTDAIIAAVSLAIAAIPEEFPVVFTLFLTLGAWRMAHRSALMRRLVGVETLGSVNVICTDKTGTITTGTMTVDEVALDSKIVSAKSIHNDGFSKDFVESAVLSCEIEPFDSLEQAILEFAWESGYEPSGFYQSWRLEKEYPFDTRLKYMSHIWQSDGKTLLCAKGSVESIVKLCKLTPDGQKEALELNRQMTEKGDRVIALARKNLDEITGDRGLDEIEMQFVGLIGLFDPVRPGVRESVIECQNAGVRVVMLTGDHPLTAHSIAEKIDLVHEDSTIQTGSELGGENDQQLQKALRDATIFARLLPEQKLRIVEGYQKLGRVVAVTGDGINDAPALRKADIGVAMGKRGTEVAREAATMVLLDDNFTTIVKAVEEGRRIYDNLQKAFNYLIAFHLPILLSALIVPLMGLPLLLLPIHIIWMELLLHPTVSVVFGEEAAEADLMRRPPRGREARDLIGKNFARPVIEGIAGFLGALILYLYYLPLMGNQARTIGITSMITAQLILVIVEHSRVIAGLKGLFYNRYLLPLLAVSFLTLVAAIYIPGAVSVMYLPPVPVSLFGLAVLVGALSTGWAVILKFRVNHVTVKPA